MRARQRRCWEVVVGDGRAAAHQCWRGRRDLAHRGGPVAGMIHLAASVLVYLCLTPCHMRKSFERLHAVVSLPWGRTLPEPPLKQLTLGTS